MNANKLEEIISGRMSHLSGSIHVYRGDPTFIPIRLTGGIGDNILVRDCLKTLLYNGFQLLIYSYHAEAANYFFKDTKIHQGEIPNFTWHLDIDTIAKFIFSDQFVGFATKEHEQLYRNQLDIFERLPVFERLVKQHPKDKYALTRYCERIGLNARSLPASCLGLGSLSNKRMNYYQDNPRKEPLGYMTIHDGFDVNNSSIVKNRCTKQWSTEGWTNTVSLIKKTYPKIKIVQIGSKTSRSIPGIDENLIGKTTITEAFDILSRSVLHIDGDSGMCHAATALNIPTIALWGSTPEKFYGHAQNINLRSTKSCAGACFFLTDTWMDSCPIRYSSPRCLDDITPEMVMDAIKQKGLEVF